MFFFNKILIISWKELLEIRRSILKLLIVMLFPLVTIYFVVINQGTTGVLSPEFNILLTQSFGGLFSLILLKDSITREKNQKTLEVLLTSSVSRIEIIIGKILPVLLIGTVAQIFQSIMTIIMISVMKINMNFSISLNMIILMLVINYIMCVVCLLLSIIINDDKASDIGAVGGSFAIGVLLLLITFQISALNNIISFLITIIVLIIVAIFITFMCEIILKKSFLYIRI